MTETQALEHYQISFVMPSEDEPLKQYDFFSSDRQIGLLHDKFREYLSAVAQDIQVYRPTGYDPTPSASQTLNDIFDACGMEDSISEFTDFAKASATAVEIDEIADLNPTDTQEYVVEFVWDNGGSVDNAYAQSIAVPQGNAELIERFETELEAALYGVAYAITISKSDVHAPTGSVDEAIEIIAEDLRRWGLDKESALVLTLASDNDKSTTPGIPN